jgi:hypothetical protein
MDSEATIQNGQTVSEIKSGEDPRVQDEMFQITDLVMTILIATLCTR